MNIWRLNHEQPEQKQNSKSEQKSESKPEQQPESEQERALIINRRKKIPSAVIS
jgi:hypothetical protein